MLGLGRGNDHGFSTRVAEFHNQETFLVALPRKAHLAAQVAAILRRQPERAARLTSQQPPVLYSMVVLRSENAWRVTTWVDGVIVQFQVTGPFLPEATEWGVWLHEARFEGRLL